MEKPVILVVDDEKEVADGLTKLLEETGKYKALTAYSGEEAIEIVKNKNKGLLKSDKIRLVLLDIRMPGMDGIETLKNILEIDSHLRAVMVTAYDEDNYWIDSIFLGKAVSYVLKPFKGADLLDKIDKFFEGKAEFLKTSAANEYISSRNKKGMKTPDTEA